jgi:hypothetical protein
MMSGLRLLRVSGIVALVAALLASLSWGVANISGLVSSLDNFQTIVLPGQRLLQLEKKHYVIYYEGRNTIPARGSNGGLSVTVQLREANGTLTAIHTSNYQEGLTYEWNSHHGRAVGTFNAPRRAEYLVAAKDLLSPERQKRITIGPSFAALVAHYMVRGIGGAAIIFLTLGSVGVALLSLYDSKKKREETSGPFAQNS